MLSQSTIMVEATCIVSSSRCAFSDSHLSFIWVHMQSIMTYYICCIVNSITIITDVQAQNHWNSYWMLLASYGP